jgi:hypothetical protein
MDQKSLALIDKNRPDYRSDVGLLKRHLNIVNMFRLPRDVLGNCWLRRLPWGSSGFAV